MQDDGIWDDQERLRFWVAQRFSPAMIDQLRVPAFAAEVSSPHS